MLRVLRHRKVEGVSKWGRGDLWADGVSVMRMPSGDDATTLCALIVGIFAVVVGVLGTEAPPAGLPERTLFMRMVGVIFVALKTIWEGWLASLSLP